MRITSIVWKERIIEKLADKHGVSVAEAEAVLAAGPVVRRLQRGRVAGEDVYAALGQLSSGRT